MEAELREQAEQIARLEEAKSALERKIESAMKASRGPPSLKECINSFATNVTIFTTNFRAAFRMFLSLCRRVT